ncbi:Phosphoribosylglycinamide formyltransferase [Candidatus Nitrosotenuis uzonensis]|uniref:phosphoribosylglycinamide formyltransferase 1 n=2 Tax=Candidatus Nitrosotenuis uzonensis TaxID=1407055 RepID=A0A812F7R1_9ARCH|nr:Phosphoribosylglycinamide formyltransferase [Candidatus Nitrosotenuis uzonensis]
MNLGILISGRGSNMEAILKAVKKQKIPVKPAIVISNNPNAVGLEIAQKLGVSTETVESRGFSGTRWEYDQRIIKILYKYGVTEKDGLVCLAGFMRIISPEFIRKYKNRILNIHPAILPSFPGLHSQRQAVEYGVKYSGCTVHFVDEGVDTGPIILQSIVPVRDNDTEETLSKRILAKEHRIYPQAIKLVAEGKVKIVGRRTVITNQDR